MHELRHDDDVDVDVDDDDEKWQRSREYRKRLTSWSQLQTGKQKLMNLWHKNEVNATCDVCFAVDDFGTQIYRKI